MRYAIIALLFVQSWILTLAAEDFPWLNSSRKDQESLILFKKHYPELGITELHLKNGMKVLLKHTDEEEGGVEVRLFAKGGYSSFPQASNGLAEVAVLTGLESGIGSLTVEQQSIFLYENSLEFSPKIEANYRTIEGYAPVEAIENYLMLIKAYFSEHRFYESEFLKAVNKINASLKEVSLHTSTLVQNALCPLGICKKQALIDPLITNQFSLAKEIYQKSFHNPAEFVCVVVGDFELEKIERSVATFLATIEPSVEPVIWAGPSHVDFPGNVVHKIIHIPQRSDCVVHLAFPIDRQMSPQSMLVFKLACKIMENRINQMVSLKEGEMILTNVQDELPLYPSLEMASLDVQFRCNSKEADFLLKNVIAQVKRLHDEGPFQHEVEEACRAQSENRAMWMHCNEFWLAGMTNYTLWDAGLDLILEEPANHIAMFEKIKSFLQHAVRVDRYMTVSVIP